MRPCPTHRRPVCESCVPPVRASIGLWLHGPVRPEQEPGQRHHEPCKGGLDCCRTLSVRVIGARSRPATRLPICRLPCCAPPAQATLRWRSCPTLAGGGRTGRTGAQTGRRSPSKSCCRTFGNTSTLAPITQQKLPSRVSARPARVHCASGSSTPTCSVWCVASRQPSHPPQRRPTSTSSTRMCPSPGRTSSSSSPIRRATRTHCPPPFLRVERP